VRIGLIRRVHSHGNERPPLGFVWRVNDDLVHPRGLYLAFEECLRHCALMVAETWYVVPAPESSFSTRRIFGLPNYQNQRNRKAIHHSPNPIRLSFHKTRRRGGALDDWQAS
jgi:hypothetical protein